MREIIGILGGLIAAIGGGLYVKAVIQGKARPHPFTWGAWAVIGAVGATADLVAGGGWGCVLLFVWTVVPATVCIVSLRYNTHEDYGSWIGLVICLAGIIGWVALDNPLAAVCAVVIADLSGVWPTFKKTWADPQSEPLLNWLMDSLATLCSVLALSVLTWSTTLYPAYLLLVNLTMVFLVLRPRLLHAVS